MVSDGSWWDCDEGALISGGNPDGALSPEGTFNLSTDTSNGRTYADGIAYKVTSNPNDTSIDVGQTPNGFANGDKAILINLQAAAADNSDVGNYEILDVTETSGNNIVVSAQPTKSYDSSSWANQAVVIQRIPQYGDVTLDETDILTVSAWDGLTTTPTGAAGVQTGIIAFYANGTVDISDSAIINASLKGFRGGARNTSGPEYWGGRWTGNGDAGDNGQVRESTRTGGRGGNGGGTTLGGAGGGVSSSGQNGNLTGAVATGGGGAGGNNAGGWGKPGGQAYEGGSGGGGRGDDVDGNQHARSGGGGGGKPYSYSAVESTVATDNLTKIGLGAGSAAGGGGGGESPNNRGGYGGTVNGGSSGNPGGGIIIIKASKIISNSAYNQIQAAGGPGGDGENGETCGWWYGGGGGGAAGAHGATGGSILIQSSDSNLTADSVSDAGGTGGNGGAGGGGGTDAVVTGPAGGAGGTFINGFDKGGVGIGGQPRGSGDGGGGGGGNSGFFGKIYLE